MNTLQITKERRTKLIKGLINAGKAKTRKQSETIISNASKTREIHSLYLRTVRSGHIKDEEAEKILQFVNRKETVSPEPRKKKKKKTQTKQRISMYIDPEILEDLKTIADEKECSYGQVIRSACREYLNKRR